MKSLREGKGPQGAMGHKSRGPLRGKQLTMLTRPRGVCFEGKEEIYKKKEAAKSSAEGPD